MKKEYNDEDKTIQWMARKEMNKLKVRRQVQNFVCLMHKKKEPKKSEHGSKMGYPWIQYQTLSQEWYNEDSKNECLIPKIEGLHFVLREMSSKMIHKDRDAATAKATRARKTMMMATGRHA